VNAYFKNSGSQFRWFGLVLLLLTSPLCLAQELEDDSDAIGSRRMEAEAATGGNRFVLTPHKRNYFLVTYTDDPDDAAFQDLQNDDDAELDDAETQFQVSIKVALDRDTFTEGDAIQFGFTLKSFWQTFNDDQSAPFRETNYQPEVWYRTPISWNSFGSDAMLWGIGAEHQSNGRSRELSRSWNRVYTTITWLTDDSAFRFKPWYRIPEDSKDDPDDTDGDDNPDIHKYMGYFEFTGIHRVDDQEFGFMVRNNAGSGASNSRGAIQLDYTFPLWGRLRGYAQFFNGYGQSLIDYDTNLTTVGVGFLLSDIL
jgi:phospholipase A1